MDFSDKLVNKIQNQKPNLIISFIVTAMSAAPLVAMYQSGPDFDLLFLFFILSMLLVGAGTYISKVIRKNIIKLGEIEDFVILNSNHINETKVSHKEMLSIITHLNTYDRNFYRKNTIKKFQCLLDQHDKE